MGEPCATHGGRALCHTSLHTAVLVTDVRLCVCVPGQSWDNTKVNTVRGSNHRGAEEQNRVMFLDTSRPQQSYHYTGVSMDSIEKQTHSIILGGGWRTFSPDLNLETQSLLKTTEDPRGEGSRRNRGHFLNRPVEASLKTQRTEPWV